MNKILSAVSFLGAITVLLGAFGAHYLQEALTAAQLKNFETGVRYQMFHVIVLLFINSYLQFSSINKRVLNYLFFVGILFFSGSIYAICFGVNPKYIWPLTPIGGMLFVLGWVKMGVVFFRK